MAMLGEKLSYWKPFTDGDQPIEQHNYMFLYNPKESQKKLQKTALKALEDLKQIKEILQHQMQNNNLNKFSVCEICEFTDTIDRIVKCIFNKPSQHKEHLSQLHTIETFVGNSVQNINIKELQPSFAIEQLRSVNPNTPAWDVLIGIEGLLSMEILTSALRIYTKKLMQRSLNNANIKTVQDLVALFEENQKNGKNIVKIIKELLDKSREEACAEMDQETREAFKKHWGKAVKRDWIYQEKITPLISLEDLEKIEAWDFLKQAALTKELKDLSADEKILEKTRLFRGEKNDYLLKIEYFFNADSGRKMLGHNNFNQLKEFSNYLWSPDGRSFYMMESTSSGESTKAYSVFFETQEGNWETRAKMSVNEVYASLHGQDSRTLVKYQRQNLASIKELFASCRSDEARFIPLVTARKPEYLFQMESGQYIYVDSNYANNTYDFEVYIGSNSTYQKHAVKSVGRIGDGGTTTIILDDGGRIYSPTPFDKSKSPAYMESGGQEHELTKLNAQKFEYDTIGIKLQPMNPRHTMLDIYQ